MGGEGLGHDGRRRGDLVPVVYLERETEAMLLKAVVVVRLACGALHYKVLMESRHGFSSDERGVALDSGQDVPAEHPNRRIAVTC